MRQKVLTTIQYKQYKMALTNNVTIIILASGALRPFLKETNNNNLSLSQRRMYKNYTFLFLSPANEYQNHYL